MSSKTNGELLSEQRFQGRQIVTHAAAASTQRVHLDIQAFLV